MSVVLLPSENRYPHVHEQLKQWIGDGLLGNFIWMTADDITREDYGPPTIRGTVWGLDEDRELTGISVNAFEELAKNRFKIVRLIAVRVLSNTYEVDSEEYEKFDLFSDAVRLALPLAMGTDKPGDKTDLRRINLVIYPTELRKHEYSTVFKGQWDHHVVASPEDRKTQFEADKAELDLHLVSRVQLYQRHNPGIDRDGAIRALQQIDDDEAILEAGGPEMTPTTPIEE